MLKEGKVTVIKCNWISVTAGGKGGSLFQGSTTKRSLPKEQNHPDPPRQSIKSLLNNKGKADYNKAEHVVCSCVEISKR